MLAGCGKQKDEQHAVEQLSEIEQLISAEKYNAAILALDSLHANFPKMIELRRRALALEDTISQRQNRRTVAFCDSLMAVRAQEIDSMSSFFRLEKDAKYQVIGNLVYKNQKNTTLGSSIQVLVDESDYFQLVKYNFGIKNMPTFLTVSTAEIYASTDTISLNSVAYHSFDADGGTVESVTFSNEQATRFAAFVKQFADQNLTLTQHGKKNIAYTLSANEKQSISITYTFWKLKKDLQHRKLEKQKALTKLNNNK
jgi:hypothetical protein